MTRANSLFAASAVAFILIGSYSPASSADLGSEERQPIALPESPWSFRFTPYAWASFVTGDVSVAGREFDVKQNPIELVEALDFSKVPAWLSYAEARRGNVFLFNDIVFAKLEGSGDFATSRSRRQATLSLGADVEADYEQLTVEVGGGFEVAKWQSAHGGSSVTSFDVLAGARYWRQETQISAQLSGNLQTDGLIISGDRGIAASGVVDWIDPFVGARMRHQVAPGESIMLRGDIGGFGAGSEFSWQAMGTYNWLLCTDGGIVIDGYLGYRALSVDYEQGSGLNEYEYDVLQHGPVVGLTTRF